MDELAETQQYRDVTPRDIRHRLRALRFDDSGDEPSEFAIYTLSDPRDLRLVRYVGQTADPGRRHAQHVAAARLSIPDTTPWWIPRPELRPLYTWIRALHSEGGRLPAMIVAAWCQGAVDARALERETILRYLAEQMPLLNREAGSFGKQIPLWATG
jgi:hypothetical protein